MHVPAVIWMNKVFSMLLVVNLLAISASITDIIRVNIEGNDGLCQEGNKIPCKSLERANDLLKQCGNDVSVTIEVESNMTLDTVFEVVNSANIQIVGNTSSAKIIYIQCTPTIAGFIIDSVHNFSFKNLAIVNCTAKSNYSGYPYKFAMLIQFSTLINLENAHFENYSYTAVVLLNNNGLVTLRNVVFVHNYKFLHRKNNYANESHPGALSIQQNSNGSNAIADYTITDSIFHYNSSPEMESTDELSKFNSRGYGGAVFVAFGSNTIKTSLTIQNSCFTHNTGRRGGALYAHYSDNAQNNTITIRNSSFLENGADVSGGGINIGYYNSTSPSNRFIITNCNFINNTAKYGAGLTFFSTYYQLKPPGYHGPIITNSTWHKNSAVISSAVDVVPVNLNIEAEGFLPVPRFVNCTFSQNVIDNTPHHGNKTYHINTGVFSITKFKVLFGEKTVFYSNKFSAILLESGIAEFLTGSRVLFQNNLGYNGGAVAIYGFSTMVFNSHSFIEFSNNHAMNLGGAIYYHTSDQHSFIMGDYECFLRNRLSKTDQSLIDTIVVVFENNTAEVNGLAIYSESFYSCHHRCLGKFKIPISIDNVFECVGNFSYVNPNNISALDLASSGRTFEFSESPPFSYTAVIPGDKIKLPFRILDDFNQTVQPLMSIHNNIFMVKHSNKMYVKYPYSLSNIIRPRGEPNTSSELTASVIGVRQIYFPFTITLGPCPPGYHYFKRSGSCKCASGKDGYEAITKCNNFMARFKSDLWVGYIPENSIDYKDLYFTPCTDPICSASNKHLPRSHEDLNEIVCGKHRKGIMCGHCIANYSIFYHSRHFECSLNQHCHLGALFYIISEIIPMVAFFVIAITFDFSFTSGKTVGFIFFTQYSNQLTVHINSLFSHIRTPYRIFYGLFNFEFFNIESLSFCLWEDAQILEVLAVKYLTVVIALVLVLTFIAVLHNNLCNKLFRLRSRVSTKTSVVHGLSAFLVICYAQCTKASFYILKYTRPVGYKGTLGDYYTYYGGLPYFHKKHLFYAVPALFSLVFVTILPPLVLLLYPLSLQLLSLCGLSEHWLVNKILQVTGINKLKSFIDCFQSCYKDKLRFFSGLYFVYRVALLVVFTLIYNGLHYRVSSLILLVLFLGIHATVQPYKESLHNTIDSLVFFNLAMINGCFIISKLRASQIEDHDLDTNDFYIMLVNSVQLVLLYLPMFVVLFHVGRFGFSRMKLRCHRNQDMAVQVDDILDHCDHNRILTSSHSAKSNGEESKYGSLDDTY